MPKDETILARCACTHGHVLVLDTWVDDDDKWCTLTLIDGYRERGIIARLKLAWKVLVHADACASDFVITTEVAAKLVPVLKEHAGCNG